MKKRVIIAAILAGAGIAAVLVWRFGNGRDTDGMILSGNVEVTEVNTGFKIPGRVTVLLTDEGRQVKTGDKIALLDNAEYIAQTAQSRAIV